MCVAPATWPVMMVLETIFLRYSAENGDMEAGADRSTLQFMRFVIVPELVACEADEGEMMCMAL